MRVYDCVVYCGEADILEWRLTELQNVADVHVIVEASRGYSGLEKPLHFLGQTDRFRQWLGRIRYIVVEDMPETRVGTRGMFDRENIQRKRILDGLADAADGDLVLVSDVDEIPAAAAVTRYRQAYERERPGVNSPLVTRAFPMSAHSYWLDLRVPSWEPWWGTRITTAAITRKLGPQGVRLSRVVAQGGRTRAVETDGQPFAGWHLSSFGGVEAMQSKLSLWSHNEPHFARYNDPDHLRMCLYMGWDWDKTRGVKMEWQPKLDKITAPAAVLANLDRWRHHLGDIHNQVALNHRLLNAASRRENAVRQTC